MACSCGLFVRAQDFATVSRLAEKHAKTCGKGVRQLSRTSPFIIPDDPEDES